MICGAVNEERVLRFGLDSGAASGAGWPCGVPSRGWSEGEPFGAGGADAPPLGDLPGWSSGALRPCPPAACSPSTEWGTWTEARKTSIV